METAGKFLVSDLPSLLKGEPSSRFVQHALLACRATSSGLPTGQPATTTPVPVRRALVRNARPQDVTDWLKGRGVWTAAKEVSVLLNIGYNVETDRRTKMEDLGERPLLPSRPAHRIRRRRWSRRGRQRSRAVCLLRCSNGVRH